MKGSYGRYLNGNLSKYHVCSRNVVLNVYGEYKTKNLKAKKRKSRAMKEMLSPTNCFKSLGMYVLE